MKEQRQFWKMNSRNIKILKKTQVKMKMELKKNSKSPFEMTGESLTSRMKWKTEYNIKTGQLKNWTMQAKDIKKNKKYRNGICGIPWKGKNLCIIGTKDREESQFNGTDHILSRVIEKNKRLHITENP